MKMEKLFLIVCSNKAENKKSYQLTKIGEFILLKLKKSKLFM